jgi:hypothetical protein
MSSSHQMLQAITTAPKVLKEKAAIECKLIPPSFWLELTNTPRSYELFDTEAEEITARAQHAEKKNASPATPSQQERSKDHLAGSPDKKFDKEAKLSTQTSLPYSYFLYGCHGELSPEQFEVAKWMDAFLSTQGYNHNPKKSAAELKLKAPLPERTLVSAKQTLPQFAIVTGDNLYTNGASSPNDNIFNRCFHDIYTKKNIYFHVLGNHDCNRHRMSTLFNLTRGISVAANEIAHTYLNSRGEYEPAKLAYLSQPFISLETLSKNNFHWFLPSRCYEFTYKGTTFLMLDSNHIGEDYIEYQDIINKIKLLVIEKNKCMMKPASLTTQNKIAEHDISIAKLSKKLETNPAYWLEQAFIRHPQTRKVLVWHHPIFTPGKRSEEIDTPYYLDRESLRKLAEYGININDDYSTLLKTILIRLKIAKKIEPIERKIATELLTGRKNTGETVIAHIDALHCAHEHLKLISNNRIVNQDTGVFQIIAGGGGGKGYELYIHKYDHARDIGFHTSFGFDVVTLSDNPKTEIHVEAFNINGEYWHFTDHSLEPVFNFKYLEHEKDKNAYLQIRTILLDACYSYFNFRSQPRKSAFEHHGKAGITRALNMLNVLNNPIPTSFEPLFKLITSCPPDCKLMTYIKPEIPNIIDTLIAAELETPAALKAYQSPTDEPSPSYELELEDVGGSFSSAYVAVNAMKK